MDRLSGITVFAKVVERGGFSAAARELGVSKSAVSKQVARLEDRLGARLLNRTTRRLSTTEVGAAFHARCQRILAEVEEAELAVGRLHDQPRGTLRINAPMSFGVLHLAPLLPEFLARHPEVTVDLALTDRIVDLVDEGFDVAVRIARLPDSSLVARRVGSFKSVVCATAGYWRRHGTPGAPADLARHNCLLYTYLVGGEEWRFHGPGGAVGVHVDGTFRANNGDALKAVALAGVGVIRAPDFIVGDALADGRLQAVLTEYEAGDAGIFAVFPHSRHLSVKVRAFVDFLAERLCPAAQRDRRK